MARYVGYLSYINKKVQEATTRVIRATRRQVLHSAAALTPTVKLKCQRDHGVSSATLGQDWLGRSQGIPLIPADANHHEDGLR